MTAAPIRVDTDAVQYGIHVEGSLVMQCLRHIDT